MNTYLSRCEESMIITSFFSDWSLSLISSADIKRLKENVGI